MSILPFNITNPGIWIDGILTSAERGFVTNLQGLNYETGDILYANSDGELVLLKAGTNGEFVKLVSGVPAWASAAAAADDTAYDATTWNGNTDAATKNAIRDKIESLGGGHDAVTLAGTGTYLSLSGQVITVDAITESDISDLGTYSTDIHSNATALDAVSGTNTGDEVDMTATVGGLVPTPPNNTTTFLRGDGTFASPPTGGTVDVLSNVATARIIGRTTASSGDSEELTAAQTRTLLNVADGATANSTNATLLARANHTGTQLAATISNFAVTVRATVLTGLSTASSAAVAAGDTILVAIGKLQAQVTNRVSKTGNETIAGVKTFSSSPIVPAPTTDLQAATKKYVDDNGGGDLWGDPVDADIIPDTTNTYELGSSSKDFSNLNVRNISSVGGLVMQMEGFSNSVGHILFSAAEPGDENISFLTLGSGTNLSINLRSKGAGTIKANGVEVATVDSALMDSEVTNLAQVKAFDSTDYATSAQGTTADNALVATAYDDATAAEVNTGTSTAKYVSPDSLKGSKYGVRTIVRDVIAHDADQATGTTLGGDFVMPIGGTVIEVGITVSTAGTTGVGTYDIHKNGTTILSTKITVDSGEKTSRTAATDSVISVAAVAEGDIYTFDIDGVQSTAAKGAQFFIRIRE